nr:MAG TPA: DNA-damage-inducible protein D [Caudoviricetes sp.]
MVKDINTINESLFESIKHINEYGMEYWTARELMPVLEYKQWRQFSDTVDRAKTSCELSGNAVSLHFADVRKSSNPHNLSGFPTGWCKIVAITKYATTTISSIASWRKSHGQFHYL